MIQNPILPGFNPDPAIIRAGDDYYIAVSSFEWYPGVPIYHSRDLVHWRLLDYALKSKRHIDLSSLAPSKGVWAPCLTYCREERRFYLVYSNVYGSNALSFEIDNFLIWADNIHGPWSAPVYLNSCGIDPSLFHDEDGRKWVVTQERKFRPDSRSIVLQEYSPEKRRLISKPLHLTCGATRRGFTEGAHLYKRNGWYYLITAEGGTGYGHSVCLLRAKTIEGPYRACPHNPILTSQAENFISSPGDSYNLEELYNPETILQKAGHGSLVETQNGRWYMAHLCARPVLPHKKCVLGRETALQEMEWTADGWLRMADGGNIAKDTTPSPGLPACPFDPEPGRCDFDSPALPLFFNSPRNEITSDWADLSFRKGCLRLRGREALSSNHCPSLIARRLTAFDAAVTTKMEFSPDSRHHLAGLTCYYESGNYYAVYKTYDDIKGGNVLTVSGAVNGCYSGCGGVSVAVDDEGAVFLRAEIHRDKLRFLYSYDGTAFQKLGETLDMTTLSDEASLPGKFTGTFVGVFAQDCLTREKWAEFHYFEYLI